MSLGRYACGLMYPELRLLFELNLQEGTLASLQPFFLYILILLRFVLLGYHQ